MKTLLPDTTCHTSTVEDDTFPQANFGRGPGGTCTAGKPDSLGHAFSGTERHKLDFLAMGFIRGGVVEFKIMNRYHAFVYIEKM